MTAHFNIYCSLPFKGFKNIFMVWNSREEVSYMPCAHRWYHCWGLILFLSVNDLTSYNCFWCVLHQFGILWFHAFNINLLLSLKYQVSSFSTSNRPFDRQLTSAAIEKPMNCEEIDFVRWKNCLQRDFTINGWFMRSYILRIQIHISVIQLLIFVT